MMMMISVFVNAHCECQPHVNAQYSAERCLIKDNRVCAEGTPDQTHERFKRTKKAYDGTQEKYVQIFGKYAAFQTTNRWLCYTTRKMNEKQHTSAPWLPLGRRSYTASDQVDRLF